MSTRRFGRWTRWARPSHLGEKFDRVSEAGFDGMAIDLGALSAAEAEATVPHFARTGLLGGLTAFPKSVERCARPGAGASYSRAFRRGDRPGNAACKLDEMVPVIERWLRGRRTGAHAHPIRDASQLHHQ